MQIKMSLNKIGTKLFLGFLTMAMVAAGILWLVQAGLMRNTYLNEQIDRVSAEVASAELDGSADYASLSETLQAGLVVLTPDGSVVFRSQRLPMMGMMAQTLASSMSDVISGNVQVIEPVHGSGRYALFGRQLADGNVLVVVFSLADVDQAALILRRQLVTVTVVLLISAVLLAVLLSIHLSRPILAVTAAANELASGHLSVQLPVRSKDEIGQLTAALNDLSRQLQQNDHLQKELIANVSHELRSPLAIIRGYAETVRDVTWPDETKRTEQLSMIAAESSRLTAVVQDILDFSRLEAGVEKLILSTFDICPVCEQLAGRYRQEAVSAGLSLHIVCRPMSVRFDRNRIDQVLNNLLDNAINHAQAGTAIEIDVQPEEKRPYVRVSIKNAGTPIAAAELPRIWDRYHQAGAQGGSRSKGTGLGLAIVRSICEQHQVPYGVISRQGQTIFWFCAERAEDDPV